MNSNKIYLREINEKDITVEYLSWFEDEEVTHFLESRNLRKEQVIEYIENGKKNSSYYIYSICDKETNKHIGNLKIGNIDRKHMISDLVTVIGDKSYWGMGIATESIKIGNSLAFEKYNIRKLSGGIYSGNAASVKSYLNAGWVIEAVLKGHYILNGDIQDRICVSCFNPIYFKNNIE